MYGLTNPDRTNMMEVMPVYRQRYYAIITRFDVNYTDHKDFEFFTKDTIRYYQNFQGVSGRRELVNSICRNSCIFI